MFKQNLRNLPRSNRRLPRLSLYGGKKKKALKTIDSVGLYNTYIYNRIPGILRVKDAAPGNLHQVSLCLFGVAPQRQVGLFRASAWIRTRTQESDFKTWNFVGLFVAYDEWIAFLICLCVPVYQNQQGVSWPILFFLLWHNWWRDEISFQGMHTLQSFQSNDSSHPPCLRAPALARYTPNAGQL